MLVELGWRLEAPIIDRVAQIPTSAEGALPQAETRAATPTSAGIWRASPHQANALATIG